MKKLMKSQTLESAMKVLTSTDEEIATVPILSIFAGIQIHARRAAARDTVAAWLLGMNLDSREWTHEGFERINGLSAESEGPLSVEHVDHA